MKQFLITVITGCVQKRTSYLDGAWIIFAGMELIEGNILYAVIIVLISSFVSGFIEAMVKDLNKDNKL